LGDRGTRTLETLHTGDGVLMFGSQHSLSACSLSAIDLVLEHLERGVLVSTSCCSCGRSTTSINLFSESPLASSLLELHGSVIMTCSNYCVLRSPNEIEEGQIVSFDALHCSSTRVDISEVNAAVMRTKCDRVSRRTPLAGVHPSVRVIKLKDWLTKGNAGTEALRGSLIHSLEESVEDTALEVSGGGDDQAVIGVPINLEDGGLVLLNVLANPPVLLLFEVANADKLGTGGDGELVLFRAPLALSGGTVETENYKHGLPLSSFEGPHVRVSVLRARNNSVGLRGPVDGGDDLIVLS